MRSFSTCLWRLNTLTYTKKTHEDPQYQTLVPNTKKRIQKSLYLTQQLLCHHSHLPYTYMNELEHDHNCITSIDSTLHNLFLHSFLTDDYIHDKETFTSYAFVLQVTKRVIQNTSCTTTAPFFLNTVQHLNHYWALLGP